LPPQQPNAKSPDRGQGFRQQSLNERVDEYKRDLDGIEETLEQLKREYDLYFAGARKRPPFELRTQVERLLRKWRSSTIQKLELTFRLNTLNSKFNAMTDIWEKIMKRREVDPHALSPYGPRHPQPASAQAREQGAAEARIPAAASAGPAPGAARSTATAATPIDRETKLKRLYDQYVDAKKDLGETIDALSFSKFQTQLEKQVDQIRQKTQCKDVEFGVIRKDGKVSLTAKPVKG